MFQINRSHKSPKSAKTASTFMRMKDGKRSRRLLQSIRFSTGTLEFPDIFYDDSGKKKGNQGFDGVVGNPPWNIIEPNIDEFFSNLYNDKNNHKFSLLTKPEKNEIIKTLLVKSNIYNKYKKYLYNISIIQNFFKKSTSYKFQIPKTDGKRNKIKMNIYKLFVERFLHVSKINGKVGIITPSGLYSDLGANGLRSYLFEENKIVLLYGFINKKGIFQDIHRQFKFMILVCRKGGCTSYFKSGFNIDEINKSIINKNSIDYDINLTRIFSPNALSIIEVRNLHEIEILNKIAVFPMLSKSPWNLDMQREFNITDDAHLFNTAKKGIPIYEGKMINQFDHLFSHPRYWIDDKKAKKILETREYAKSIWKKNSVVNRSIPSQYYRLVWRLTTNATNTRTLICTILPPNTVTVNSLNYIRPLIFDGKTFVELRIDELFYLCAMLNSFVVDFVMRKRIASAINIFHMKEIKIPKLSQNNILLQKLSKYAAELICTTKEFEIIKKELQVTNIPTNIDERKKIISKINALSAKIYGLDKKDFEYILSTFNIADKEIKQNILLEFDEIESQLSHTK